MTISSIPSNTASAITPFNPLGKSTVGEEEKDSKNSSFKAVEESPNSARNMLRQDNQQSHIDAVSDDEDREGRQRQEGRDEGRQGEEEQARERQRLESQELEEIRRLAIRDREVRDHERAHASVGGQYTGAPSYRFKRGPDGISYAVAGEVSIRTGIVNDDPQSTMSKAQQIRRAALAPADPSPQDRRVAASATRLELQARAELIESQHDESERKKALQEQQRSDAEKKSAANTQDEQDDNHLSAQAADQQNHRKILDIQNKYISLNTPSRPGSIVSEAV